MRGFKGYAGYNGLVTTDTSIAAIRASALKYAVPATLAAIVLVGALVRIIAIDENPPGFFTDEASVGYNAYTILKHGTDEHGEPWPVLFRAFGEFKLPVYIYTTVPFVAVLGLTEFAVRLASATYGVVAIVTVFLLASAVFRQRTAGLAAAFFLAIMPWHIHYSRTGFGEMVSFIPLITLSLYLVIRGVRGDDRFLIASGAAFGLTLYTYRAAWVVLPPLLVVIVALYWRELLRRWRPAAYGAGAFAIIGVPLLLHFLSGGGDRSQDAGILSLDLSAWETVKRFVEQYRSYFSLSYLFLDGDDGPITRHYLPGAGHLHLVQLPLIAMGLLGLVIQPTREKMLVLALLVLYPLGGALSTESPISTRSILGTAALAIVSGYGLMVLVNGLASLNRPYNRVAVATTAGVVVALALVAFGGYLSKYHGEYREVSAGFWGWQSGPEEIVAHFESVEDEYDQLIMDGEFNAPRMFFRFYAPEGCEKCTIGGTALFDPNLRQLFALKPHNIDSRSYNIVNKRIIEYPDSTPAFLFIELKEPG